MKTKNITSFIFLISIVTGLGIGLYKVIPIAWESIYFAITTGVNTEIDITQPIPFSGGTSLLTGTLSSGTISVNNTGIVNIGTELSLLELISKDYITIRYELEEQPIILPIGSTYNQRSQILVDYMTKNTIKIPPGKSENAYMYIKLRKKPVYPIFIYWYGSSSGADKRSGDLILEHAKEKISDQEFLFDMKDISYIRFHDKVNDRYNWLSNINQGKSLFISFASKGFDGNGVEEIKIFKKK